MAENWITVSTTDTRYCYVSLQYDANDGGTTSRHARLRMTSKPSSSVVPLNYFNITVKGTNYGSKSGVDVDQNVWDGWISSGSCSYSYQVNWYDIGTQTYSGSGSIPTGHAAPSGLTATLGAVSKNSAKITINLNSYGYPDSASSRYIEAAVLGTSAYGAPYRYKTKTASTSGTFTIDNNSSGSLTIAPNTKYWYGGYANNSQDSINTVAGSFTTLPATPVVNAVDQGHGQIDFTVTHAPEGSGKTVTESYSIDGGTTWNTITGGAFTLVLAAQTVVTVKRSTSVGSETATVTVSPTFNQSIYVPIADQTRKAKKVYASVNGETKKIKKVYASVNGETALVFEDIT